MQLEVFSQGSSPVHRLDPRVKLTVFVPAAVLCASSDRFSTVITLLFAAGTLITAARLWSALLWQRMLVINTFVLFLWLTLPFSMQGTPVMTTGPMTVTAEGLMLSMLITLKTNAISLMTIALPGTTPVMSLAHALQHLGMPSKLVNVFYIFYRYSGVIVTEFETMKQTLKARGFSPATNMHTVRTWASVAGMLFIRSFERAERISSALRLRGFQGQFPLMNHFRATRRDVLFAMVSFCCLTILMFV